MIPVMKKKFLSAEWGIAAAVFAVFGYAALTADFVALDDFKLIVGNSLLQKLDWESVKGMFTTFDPDLYVPFTLLSYHIDRIVAGGFEPWMFHLTNLVLHAANAVLVSIVIGKLSGNPLRRGFAGYERGVGLVAGLLFAIHPLQTEAVLWASARKDLLATMFFLLSVRSYLEYRKTQKIQMTYVPSLLWFLCGLLSKVSIVPLPVILILIDWYRGEKFSIKDKLPYFALSVVFGCIALVGMEGETSQGLATIILAARAILFYVQKLVLPIGLSALVPYTDPVSFTNPELIYSTVIVLAVTGVALAMRRSKLLSFAWLFFVIMLIPSFGNFVKGNEFPLDVYLASDRYAYIPSIAFCFLIGVIASYRIGSQRNIGIFVLFVLFAFLSFRQSLTWKTTPALYINVVRHYDNSHLAFNNIAAMLIEQGHIDPAIEQLRKSIAVKPNSRAYFNLGRIAELRGDPSTAAQAYREALKYNPGYSEAQEYLRKLGEKTGN